MSTNQWPTGTAFYNSANSMMILYVQSTAATANIVFYEAVGNGAAPTSKVYGANNLAVNTLLTFEVPYGFTFNGIWTTSMVWNTIALH